MRDTITTVRTTSDDDDGVDGNDGVRDKIRATRNIISHDIPRDDDSRKINDGGAKKDVNKMKKNNKKRLRNNNNNDDDVITEGHGLQSPTVSTLTSSPQKKSDEAPPTKKPRNSSGYIRYNVIMMSSIIIIPFLQFLSISSDIIRSQSTWFRGHSRDHTPCPTLSIINYII